MNSSVNFQCMRCGQGGLTAVTFIGGVPWCAECVGKHQIPGMWVDPGPKSTEVQRLRSLLVEARDALRWALSETTDWYMTVEAFHEKYEGGHAVLRRIEDEVGRG